MSGNAFYVKLCNFVSSSSAFLSLCEQYLASDCSSSSLYTHVFV